MLSSWNGWLTISTLVTCARHINSLAFGEISHVEGCMFVLIIFGKKQLLLSWYS